MLATPVQRTMRGNAFDVAVTLPDAAGEPDTGETVTVEVLRADGTVLKAAGTATTETGTTGVYKVALTAAQATLDLLVATWSVASVVRAMTYHEVVGGVYFSVEQLRAAEPTMVGDPTLDLVALRDDVEVEFESITEVAWVPRYQRVRLDGTGTTRLGLPDARPRSNADGSAAVRSVRVYSSVTTYTSFTATELASLWVVGVREIHRRDGGVFAAGHGNIVIDYEHGYDAPAPDLRRAALRRARTRRNMSTKGIPDRAISFTAENGATYRLSTPGEKRTGDPEVDAVLARYDHSTVL